MKILRAVLGVIAGVAVAWLCVMVPEQVSHHLYPFPRGANMRDIATIKKFVATLPASAFVLVLTGWFAGTLLGTFVAAWIGRGRGPAYVVGVLLLAGGIMNAALLPQPVWFIVAGFLIFLTVPFAGMAMAPRSNDVA